MKLILPKCVKIQNIKKFIERQAWLREKNTRDETAEGGILSRNPKLCVSRTHRHDRAHSSTLPEEKRGKRTLETLASCIVCTNSAIVLTHARQQTPWTESKTAVELDGKENKVKRQKE